MGPFEIRRKTMADIPRRGITGECEDRVSKMEKNQRLSNKTQA